MTNSTKIIKVRKNSQQYLNKILLDYPNISSGRKNYKDQYKRILKNLLLAQAYNSTMRKKSDILLFEVKFIEDNMDRILKDLNKSGFLFLIIFYLV